MDRSEAMITVFKAFMALPDSQKLVSSGKPISADVFLNNPAAAKAIFGGEPGCPVNYEAIKEKTKVLEPHMKGTKAGPGLLKYFGDLRNQRNKWAVAFANYESHTVKTYFLERHLYGRGLTTAERDGLNANRPELPVVTMLNAAENKLLEIKSARSFVQNIRILEECISNHKRYMQRKAHAAEMKRAKKKRAEAAKAKNTALATAKLVVPRQADRSTFNPDMPDFAQFLSGYAVGHQVTPPSSSPQQEIRRAPVQLYNEAQYDSAPFAGEAARHSIQSSTEAESRVMQPAGQAESHSISSSFEVDFPSIQSLERAQAYSIPSSNEVDFPSIQSFEQSESRSSRTSAEAGSGFVQSAEKAESLFMPSFGDPPFQPTQSYGQAEYLPVQHSEQELQPESVGAPLPDPSEWLIGDLQPILDFNNSTDLFNQQLDRERFGGGPGGGLSGGLIDEVGHGVDTNKGYDTTLPGPSVNRTSSQLLPDLGSSVLPNLGNSVLPDLGNPVLPNPGNSVFSDLGNSVIPELDNSWVGLPRLEDASLAFPEAGNDDEFFENLFRMN